MKKVYSLKHEIMFKNTISDILSIAIDKRFSLDGYAIKGQFFVNGQYLVRDKEKDEFNIEIPYLNYIEDIYDVSKVKVDIEDFYYEIKNDNKLVLNIEIFVDGLIEKEVISDIEFEDIDDRCITPEDEIDINNDIELISNEEINSIDIEEFNTMVEEENKNIQQRRENILDNDLILEENNFTREREEKNMEEREYIDNNSLFSDNGVKEFVTYKVCIIRQGDTIDSILEKYGVTMDSLNKYNTINELREGDKIIIPYEKN